MVKKILVVLIDGSQYELEEMKNIMSSALYDTDYTAIITNKKTDLMTLEELIAKLQMLKLNEPSR